jgi:hypothetical protein
MFIASPYIAVLVSFISPGRKRILKKNVLTWIIQVRKRTLAKRKALFLSLLLILHIFHFFF